MPHESTLFSSQVRRRLEERTANAEEKVRQLEVDFAAYKSKAETESRKLTVTVRELKHQLRHSEQRVKAKETVLERLQEKLRTLVDLEKKGRERDRGQDQGRGLGRERARGAASSESSSARKACAARPT